ncbi:hypothetical protein [Streptomyces sp. NPDC049555]|uniref:hypothetical protein n=1 Tax=unclassified Streptomyces TaxID=2593676 RepID=UPI003434ECA9
MATPELLGAGPFAPPPARTLKARLGGVCVVLLGIYLMDGALTNAWWAAGYAEHQGMLTVRHCHVEHTGHSGDEQNVCEGVFHPSDGGPARVDAALNGSYVPGERVKVYRDDARYAPVSLRSCWGWLFFFFLLLLIATYGVVVTAVGFSPKDSGRRTAARERLRGTVLAAPVIWLLRLGGAGAVVCFLLACVVP